MWTGTPKALDFQMYRITDFCLRTGFLILSTLLLLQTRVFVDEEISKVMYIEIHTFDAGLTLRKLMVQVRSYNILVCAHILS